MKPRALLVRMNGADVGRVARDTHGRVTFTYDDGWRDAANTLPLSLSLPLAAREHRGGVDAYLWGLLPDSEVILDQWARRYQTSPRNPIGLLAHVGADCPGAVQLLTEEAAAQPAGDDIVWLGEREIAARLRRLRSDQSAWRDDDDAGQFSLGGAQAKTAFLLEKRRWGIPSGRLPTTHIFKPGLRELAGHVENEHFCLTLARELGLPSAHSTVERFEDQTVIVVERYDRVRIDEKIVRVHQEDFCQATATMPGSKYQNEGGPGPATIIDLLRAYSASADADIASFVDALVLGWVIVATDAHAKNYSLLHGPGGKVRLAPLYDVASVLPYTEPTLRKTKLAMSIGTKYRVNEIQPRQWVRFAADTGIEPDLVQSSLARMLRAIPDAAETVRKRAKRDGLDHAVLAKLTDAIAKRAKKLGQ